jgi:hypothetical protein
MKVIATAKIIAAKTKPLDRPPALALLTLIVFSHQCGIRPRAWHLPHDYGGARACPWLGGHQGVGQPVDPGQVPG